MSAQLRRRGAKTRPGHEQQRWQERIRRETDLEQQLPVSLLRDAPAPYREYYRALSATLSNRLRYCGGRLLRGPLLKVNPSPHGKPGAYLRQLNRQRGVHDK